MEPHADKPSSCLTTHDQDKAVPSRASLPFLTARRAGLIAIFIAVLHAFMAVTAVNTKSPTFDEPQHLTAAYSYFVTGDFRLDPENGNLPAMWATLPLLLDDLKFISLDDRAWQRGDEGRTAHQFFYEVGNDPDQLLEQARLMMSMFGAALCLLVYLIAREFFGSIGGLIGAIIAAFDPNFLAHSPLVDSDVPAAFFFTATVWTCWRLFQKITPARLLMTALSLSGLFLTKFSAPLVLPILGAVSILQIFSRNPIAVRIGRFRVVTKERWKKGCAMAATWFALFAILFVAIWASYSFRYNAWTDNRASHEGTVWHWNYLLEDGGTFENSIKFARDHHLLPEAYLYGFAYVRKHEIDRPSFLDGQWSIVGFRSFFPLAFIYKTPLPLLILLALAICAAIATHRSWKIENVFNPLWGFALLYGAFAISAQLNIGHRHLFPIYPALFVASAAVVRLFRSNRKAIVASAFAILLAWEVGESFAVRPNYLAYFNQIAGGPSHGYEHLVDSSSDWGQDLPSLKSWLDSHSQFGADKPVYLAYFGTADPRAYQIKAELISPGNLLSQTPTRLRGGLYCMSATTLQSVYAHELGPWCAVYERSYRTALAEVRRERHTVSSPNGISEVANPTATTATKAFKLFERLRFERLCAYLRHQHPIAQIGYSILVFDLTEDDINRALYGPPAELHPWVSVSGY